MGSKPFRVFVSYTAEDLSAHADVVVAAIQGLNMMPIDHRNWSATGRPSVAECKRQIESCQILVVLVAHRFGWVPGLDEGGNQEQHSITQIEVNHAKARGLRVLPFVVRKDAEWKTNLIEGYGNAEVKSRLDVFKAELQKTLAGFFGPPVSLDGPVSRALQAAADDIERSVGRTKEADDDGEENELILPWTSESGVAASLPERLGSQLPKRVLAIDDSWHEAGASLGLLQRIQEILRIRYGREDFFLSDYYDLIVGTGWASFVTTLLAMRMDVLEVQDRFSEFSRAAVGKPASLLNRFKNMYSDDLLLEYLPKVFGDATLGDTNLQTGLLLVTSRLETSEPFGFTNHPAWNEYERWAKQPLVELVRACASRPTYLPIRRLAAKVDGKEGVFADGILSIGSNPALYGLLAVTSERFPFFFFFRWRFGRTWLSLTSVGGRSSSKQKDISEIERQTIITSISSLIDQMIQGASTQGKMMLEALGLGAEGEEDSPRPSKFTALTYRRYELSDQSNTISVREKEDPFKIGELTEIPDKLSAQIAAARQAAKELIVNSQFLKPFDVRRPANI